MRAWESASVPELPIAGPPVRVFDSATREIREVTPADGPARLYVCGITPYDATHMGHAATYVAFDLLNRAWRSAGHGVRYVQNVTDVDDPLLERADDTGDDWQDLAQRETQLFRDDMTALRVLPPDAYVGVVESIPLVVDEIQRLQEAGAVYDVEGDLYFSVTSDPTFGSVSGFDREQMMAVFAERGGDPERPGKKDPLDCLVWRAERPGEPAWDSPYGRGRPGWHVECTAIATHELGQDFDVQGGGSDLVFPHHEMCAAEAQCAAPEHRFARAYVHAGMVGLDGEKMSKSKGNLVKVSQLRAAGLDPMVIRLVLLGHHYRSDWSWEESDVSAAGARLDRWREACSRAAGARTDTVVPAVLTLLAGDLDAPTALREIDHWADATVFGAADEPGAGESMRALVDAALGVAL